METTPPGATNGRRRSQRVVLSIPITVSGETSTGKFSEETKTMVINAHGALIGLASRVSAGQLIELKSHTHPETRMCRIVYVGPAVDGKLQCGVEFLEPSPNFWRIAFPPEDWAPLIEADVPLKVSKS